jgi:hypothetical protein
LIYHPACFGYISECSRTLDMDLKALCLLIAEKLFISFPAENTIDLEIKDLKSKKLHENRRNGSNKNIFNLIFDLA